MERKVLGRGLEALIQKTTPETASDTASKERVQTLPLDQIQPGRFQPRLSFSEEKIGELALSIKEKGIIQPVLVRQIEGGRYELIAGERRYRAAKKAGLTEIPVIIRRVSDADAIEVAIIENIQREDLNPLDEAKAYQRLMLEFGLNQDSIATKVGKDKSSVSNILRLLNLPEKIQECVSRNLISFGHARALLSLTDPKVQADWCDRIILKGLSVRQVEQATAKRVPKVSAKRLNVDPDIQNLENDLQQTLGTKVRIRHARKRGRIEIEYYSIEDLERLLRRFGVPS